MQLAEKLNIVPATVLAYEQGRFPIPYEIAVLLAEELQISESLLFDDFCVFLGAPYTEILHTVRKHHGLNQVDFAESAGISPGIYMKWESGSRRPSRKMYQQLKLFIPKYNIERAHPKRWVRSFFMRYGLIIEYPLPDSLDR